MGQKFIWLIMNLVLFSLNDTFGAERELLCTLTPDHPMCRLSNVHVLVHWKTKPLPHPDPHDPDVSETLSESDLKKDLDEIGLASDDSEAFVNVEVKTYRDEKRIEILSKSSRSYLVAHRLMSCFRKLNILLIWPLEN